MSNIKNHLQLNPTPLVLALMVPHEANDFIPTTESHGFGVG